MNDMTFGYEYADETTKIIEVVSENVLHLDEDKSTFRHYLLGKYGKNSDEMLKDSLLTASLYKELAVYCPQMKYLKGKSYIKDEPFNHEYSKYATYLEYLGIGAKKELSFENMLRGLSFYSGGKMYVRVSNGDVKFVYNDNAYSSSQIIEVAKDLFRASDIEISIETDSVEVHEMLYKKISTKQLQKMDTTLKEYLIHGPMELTKEEVLSAFPSIMKAIFSKSQSNFVPGYQIVKSTNTKLFTMISVPSSKCNSIDINFPFQGLWARDGAKTRIRRLLDFTGHGNMNEQDYFDLVNRINVVANTAIEVLRDTYSTLRNDIFVPYHPGWFQSSKSFTHGESMDLYDRENELKYHVNKRLIFFPVGNVAYWMCSERFTKEHAWDKNLINDTIKFLNRIFNFFRHLSMFRLVSEDHYDFQAISADMIARVIDVLGKHNATWIIHEMIRINMKLWLTPYDIPVKQKEKLAPPNVTLYSSDGARLIEYDPNALIAFDAIGHVQRDNSENEDSSHEQDPIVENENRSNII